MLPYWLGKLIYYHLRAIKLESPHPPIAQENVCSPSTNIYPCHILHIIDFLLVNHKVGVFSMSNIPLIGIMVMSRKKRKKILKVHNRYKGNLKMELFCFTPRDINWGSRKIKGITLSNNKVKTKIFRFPDAVYNRCYRKKSKTLRKLEKYIGENKCFNHITFFNKWRIYSIMSRTKLGKYFPKTSFYNPETFMEQLYEDRCLILKPSYGCLGKKIYLVELTYNHGIKIYEDTLIPMYTFYDKELLMKKLSELIGKKKYIVQREIQMAKIDGKIIDLRVLVQKDINGYWEVTNGISRAAPYNFFITNHCEKIYKMDEVLESLISDWRERYYLSKEIYDTCIKTAQILEEKIGLLGEIGIDMAIDRKGLIWILEVNGKMQKSMYYELERKDDENIAIIYRRPLEYAYYLSQS